MSTGEEIDSPFTIATLTQPIEGSQGRILSSAVYGLSGSRKRKRAEIAISSDGEAVSVYNVQTSRIVASYAVPPQASFTSPPCCTYRRASSTRPARRYTYVSIAQAFSGAANSQLVCFDETARPGALGQVEKTVYDIPKDRAEVISIDTIPAVGSNSDSTSPNVLVVYRDGRTDCFTPDLKTLRSSSELQDLLPTNNSRKHRKALGKTEVEYACVTNTLSASRGLLHGREDLLAVLQGRSDASPDLLQATPLLFLATNERTSSDGPGAEVISLHLVSMRYALPSDITTFDKAPRHLASWQIPRQRQAELSTEQLYSLHSESGSLTHLTEGGLRTYDLRNGIAKQVTELGCPDGKFRSFLPITQSLALASSESFCGLFDRNYNSTKASLRFGRSSPSSTKDKKRIRGATASDLSSLSFISYLSTLDLAIARTSTDLVGIPLASVLPNRKGKQEEGLLIDSVGRGVRQDLSEFLNSSNQRGIVAVSKSQSESKQWRELLSKLDDYARQDDVVGFEAVFAEAVGIGRDTKEYDEWKAANGPKVNGLLTNGHTATLTNGNSVHDLETMDLDNRITDEPPVPNWKFPQDFGARERFRYQPISLYALSKIFSWAPKSDEQGEAKKTSSSVVVDFYAPNVFQYLLITECLSDNLVQRALRTYSDLPGDTRNIAEGDIISALVEFDPELRVLHYVLNSGSYLSIGDIAQAIKLIIQHLDTEPLFEFTSRLLPNGDAPSTDASTETDIDSVLKSMSDAIDQAQSSLDGLTSSIDSESISILTLSLQAALTTLHTFPKSRIISTLHTVLTHHELFFLMNLLRIQLRSGGWVSRYFIDVEMSDSHSDVDSPSDNAILIIANLLSSVIDTIGTGGWLLSSQSSRDLEDSPDDLIHTLRTDISAAVEGIYEATFMRGLLSEFLRFQHRSQQSGSDERALSKKKRAQKKPYPLQTGVPAYGDADVRMLPMGLVVREPPELTKRGAKGEVQKSMREVGMELSKKVPKYSIERIDI